MKKHALPFSSRLFFLTCVLAAAGARASGVNFLPGSDATQFKDTIDACRTRLYFIGDSEKWAAESKRADLFFERFRQELATLRQPQAAKR